MSDSERGKRPLVVHLISSGGFYGAERMLLEHVIGSTAMLAHRVFFIDAPTSVVDKFQHAGIVCQCVSPGRSLFRALSGLPANTVLNCHGYKALFHAWLAGLGRRRPLVATLHGFTPVSAKQRFYGRLNLALCRLPRVRKVACVADSIALIARRAGVPREKIEVIPNGIASPATADVAASPVPRPAGGPLLGFVGRLRSEKGPDLFVETFLKVRRQFPAAQAVLLGDGRDAAELKAYCQTLACADAIHFLGYSDNVPGWLAAFDVLVISSRTEGTPMILLEAMAAGTPVAAFAVGGIPDVLGKGEYGLLAPPADVEALAERIGQTLKQPGMVKNLVARARQNVAEHYNPRRLTATWAKLYQAAGAH